MEDTAELLALLNTYLYLDYQNRGLDNGSIAEALEEMKGINAYQPGGDLYEEYALLVQAVEEREGFGEIVLSNQSYVMGYDHPDGVDGKLKLIDDSDKNFLDIFGLSDRIFNCF